MNNILIRAAATLADIENFYWHRSEDNFLDSVVTVLMMVKEDFDGDMFFSKHMDKYDSIFRPQRQGPCSLPSEWVREVIDDANGRLKMIATSDYNQVLYEIESYRNKNKENK